VFSTATPMPTEHAVISTLPDEEGGTVEQFYNGLGLSTASCIYTTVKSPELRICSIDYTIGSGLVIITTTTNPGGDAGSRGQHRCLRQRPRLRHADPTNDAGSDVTTMVSC
jgi:hypothetical protein